MKTSIFSILSILFVQYVSASDPTCQNGIVGNAFVNGEVMEDVICCLDECDFCGGTGCGELPQGASNCCGGPIFESCLLYTSPSPRDATLSRMPSSA